MAPRCESSMTKLSLLDATATVIQSPRIAVSKKISPELIAAIYISACKLEVKEYEYTADWAKIMFCSGRGSVEQLRSK